MSDKYREAKRVINIHIDSLSSIQALNQNFINSEQVMRTTLALNFAGRHNRVTLKWIKAHVGHDGNEKADELAKEGSTKEGPPEADAPDMAARIVHGDIRTKVQKHWNEWWQNHPHCRQTKHFFPEVDKSKSLNYIKCGRTVFSALVQICTGHNGMNRHDFLVETGEDNDPRGLCRTCKEAKETTYHLLSECEAHAFSRFMVWGKDTLEPPYDITSKDLLEFLKLAKIPPITDILEYTVTSPTEEQNDDNNNQSQSPSSISDNTQLSITE